jgi:hypothetical protein
MKIRAGVVAGAVLALIALAGAGSASATVLCKRYTVPCGSTYEYPAGTKFSAQISGSPAVVENPISNQSCNESKLEGTVGPGGGTRVTVEITTFTLGQCYMADGTACSNTAVALPWSTQLEGIKGSALWYSGSGAGGNSPGFAQICGAMINCTYTFAGGTSTAAGKVTGGNPAKLAISAALTPSGGFCPTSAKLVGTYTVTAPAPLYVTL